MFAGGPAAFYGSSGFLPRANIPVVSAKGSDMFVGFTGARGEGACQIVLDLLTGSSVLGGSPSSGRGSYVSPR